MTSVASLYGQQSATEIQARFWKALISKVYDILDKVRISRYFGNLGDCKAENFPFSYLQS